MKIKKILLYNFKNFRHETFVDFSDNITFLVGPNGFGKTTIFDAIELGLTGNISRITQATQVTGENVAYNKPFFQNDISEPVIVKLWLEKSNGEQLVIIRKFINDNPNGGKVFAPKKSIKQFKLSQQEEVTDDNFKSIDIDNIRSSLIQQTVIDEFLDINGKYEIDTIFNLFNYIQQEETTFFLKKTEKDRSNNLSFLVKTDEIEDKISKIDKITRAIKGELRSLTKKQEKFTQQELDDTPYQRMFNQQVFQFDKERPFSTENLNQLDNFKTKVQKIIEFKQNFSISEYRRKLERDEQKKEIGASDSVLRFSILFPLIKRPNDQWRWEKYALENPILFEYVLLENYLQSFETIISENERRKQLNNYLTNLSPDITQMTAHSFQYVPNDNFSNDFELLKSQWTHYQALREGAGELDKNLSDLRRLRNNLDSKFSELKHQHVDENKCPFCSKQFDSYDDLKQAYESYETYLSEISSGNSQRLQEIQLSLNLLIQQVKQKITDEINRISTNVDEKLVAKLQELRSLYQGNSRNINGFKTFIESYTNISPYQLGSLTFDVYNQQYQSKLQEFRSKLVADAEIYSSLDISNLENIERQFDELRTEFPELQLETYQLRPNSGSKISSSTIDSLLSEIKIYINSAIDTRYGINENLIADAENILYIYFQNKVELLESIRIEDLEQKKLYLDKQSKLVQNQQLQDLSCQINTLQKAADRLEEVNTIYKEEVKQFKIGVVKQLRIPFFIYSAKMLQNYQQGLGIFLTYKKTMEASNEKAIIRFKTDPNNDHDAMNQLSTGQLAVVSLAFTLSLNTMFKLSDNLKFLMIDDPIQDMDAMNVLSFIEILRHGIIDRYQIILSTYSDHNALFMGYKFANSNSEVNIKYENVRDVRKLKG